MSERRVPSAFATLLAALASVGVIAAVQPGLSEEFAQLDRESSIYALPEPEQLAVFTLGYRAAAADLLFGTTLVEAGIHFAEHRVFEDLDKYLWAIVSLDPKFYDVYQFADSLLTLSTVEMPPENFVKARRLIEKGLENFPDEPQLWLSSGQFLAYMAPPRLPETEDKNEWRAAGARVIHHACEIWPKGTPLPLGCVSSSRYLSENGEREAEIRALERMLAVSDDPKVRAQAMARLAQVSNAREARKRHERLDALAAEQRADLPGLSESRYQLLSPPVNVAKCAGLRAIDLKQSCASSFDMRGRESLTASTP